MTATRLVFLGTGASGGTPGSGRSRRRESSLLVRSTGANVLLDATRDLPLQVDGVDHLDALLLTHAHRDASGGIPALRAWLHERDEGPLPVLASRRSIAVLHERYNRLDHCEFVPIDSEQTARVGAWSATPVVVPHARDDRFQTYAWRLSEAGGAFVYASDVSELAPQLRSLTRGARLLIIDGAMYGRSIFSHLRIDTALPELCCWPVDRILTTQIGRSAPPHEELERETARLCPRARPAYDGMEVRL
ncbi:MAG: MBL fold metallo-hydrolase [Nitriliruptorales bacterium]